MVLAMVWATIKDAAGLWHYDRFRPLIGALANLFMNLVLVNIIGLYGILLSTVLSYLLISMPWLVRNLFHLLYKRPMKDYLSKLAKYVAVGLVSCIVTIVICKFIKLDGISALIVYGGIAIVVPSILQVFFYMKMQEFMESKELISKILRIRV